VRDTITINRNNYTTSSTGQRTSDGTPTVIATISASVRQKTNDQDMVSSFNTIEEIWEFRVRNQTKKSITFQKKDIIVWDSASYQVIGISDQTLKYRFVKLKASIVK
jgi:head-tail adaptor